MLLCPRKGEARRLTARTTCPLRAACERSNYARSPLSRPCPQESVSFCCLPKTYRPKLTSARSTRKSPSMTSTGRCLRGRCGRRAEGRFLYRVSPTKTALRNSFQFCSLYAQNRMMSVLQKSFRIAMVEHILIVSWAFGTSWQCALRLGRGRKLLRIIRG